eukprot:scaffold9047_cov131-Cylindrotheca_fusiformis.AAC.2
MTRQYQSSTFSRERNRIHARKTRQRKKEQMQNLQKRADELKEQQIRLKQMINEKATASILVGLFSKDTASEHHVEDPRVEELMRRPVAEIPDATKLPELPSLILPGQHNSKKHMASEASLAKDELPDDGIDYQLLGKDRSKCTPAELDKIRRERNRMHAKRTRDRKRLFMEEMAEMCSKLEGENKLLQSHLAGLNGLSPQPSGVSPMLSAQSSSNAPSRLDSEGDNGSSKTQLSEHGVTLDQIQTLLEAAGTFSMKKDHSNSSPVSASISESEGGSISDHDDSYSRKRRKVNESEDSSLASSVPKAITTTTSPTAVGC